MDQESIAYAIFFYLGVGNLFPWNAFINAGAYFSERFCSTPYSSSFMNYFSLSFTASQTIGLALSIKYQNRLSLWARIASPLILYSSVFLLTSALVVADLHPTLLFWLTLLSTVCCGVFGAVLSGGLFGLAAIFPPWDTGALMNGQALAGLIVSVSDMLTLLAERNSVFCSVTSTGASDDIGTTTKNSSCRNFSVNTSALFYFVIATVILASCVLAFLALRRMQITQQYLTKAGDHSQLHQDEENEPFMISQHLMDDLGATFNSDRNITSSLNTPVKQLGNGNFSKDDHDLSHDERYSVVSTISAGSPGMDNGIAIITPKPIRDDSSRNSVTRARSISRSLGTPEILEEAGLSRDSVPWPRIKNAIQIVYVPAFSVFFVFVVTIGIFPALTQHLHSEKECESDARIFNDMFVPLQFFLFNLFDFIGRVTAGAIKISFLTPTNVWIASVSRAVFFPLFLLCNNQDTQLPVVFQGDLFPIIFMILFAFSNGFVSSTCMMLGPSMVPPQDAALVGTIMVFSLTAGLLGGACTSFLTTYISQGFI